MPTWRIQAAGTEDLIGRPQARPSRPVRGDPLATRPDPTPAGFVFEFEERWDHEGQEWYAREMMRAEVAGGQIAELVVYSTGD